MNDWISFYDFKHSFIYVNARHREVHYSTIAQDTRDYVPSPSAQVLDFGCGEADFADLVAAACGHLSLVDAAPNVRARLTERYARNNKISVLTPDEAAAMPAGTLDLVVMHSVAQYLSEAELDRQFAIFRALLKPGGRLVVGDVVPPKLAAPAAAVTLLRIGAANGFFWAAVGGLIRIFLSDYFRLKKAHGLSHYSQAAMLERLTRAGFAAQRAARNLGHNQWRMTFLATPK